MLRIKIGAYEMNKIKFEVLMKTVSEVKKFSVFGSNVTSVKRKLYAQNQNNVILSVYPSRFEI